MSTILNRTQNLWTNAIFDKNQYDSTTNKKYTQFARDEIFTAFPANKKDEKHKRNNNTKWNE